MSEREITVVFPTYNAVETVDELVAGIARQQAPVGIDRSAWLEVIFIDNASTDGTIERLEAALEEKRLPFPVRVMRNEENLGLARSFNRALEAVETPYVLTCHADCLFGSDDYVARAVDLLNRHPDVAVVSGQSIADVSSGLSRVEKVYLAANLMDIFPAGDGELVPVGFAEGRCDGFRMQVLRRIGFYDTTLRRAGEDQVLSARMRALGYRVCRAPALRYYLSVSSDQDSLLKLVRHAQLFGRAHPYLLIANRGTTEGIAGATAGRNRMQRALLRTLQLASALSWLDLALATATRRGRARPVGGLVVTSAVKATLFAPYVRALRFSPRDLATLAALQPALDFAYATGVAQGLRSLVARDGRTIA